MLTLISFIVFVWSIWFWDGVPGLEWIFPVFSGIVVVYSIGLDYYERFEARRKRLK